MKNRPLLFAIGLLSVGGVYALSHDSSQAQPVPSSTVQRIPASKPKISGPNTLANWMKMVESGQPWKPLNFVKLEVSKPKPVKKWVQASNSEAVYAKFAIEMTAPGLKLPPPRKRDSQMGASPELPGFPASSEIRVTEAKWRPTPAEPWVSFNPDAQFVSYSNLDWDFGGNGSTSMPFWTSKGNILRAEDSIRCPGGGQWKLKVRFRSSITDFFGDKIPSPLWGFEKIFWVETQQPHTGQSGIAYPVGLHKSWLKGFLYATNPKGPWKPIPQRGQPGFPLKWSQNNNLYVRAGKKYPAERWPTNANIIPKFTHGQRELFDTVAPNGMVALTPKQQLDARKDGKFVTVKAEAGNVATASIMVSGRSKLPKGLQSWDDLQKVVMQYGIGELGNVQRIEGLTQQVQVLPGAPATIHFNVWAARYLPTGQTITGQGLEQLTLRDSNGKLLARLPHDERGNYELQVEKPGRYFVDVDVLGPDGKPLHRRAALRSDPRYASDISQRVTLIVKPYKTTPVAASDLKVTFLPWKKSGTPNIWQRDIVPVARNARQTVFNFTIKPVAGYSVNPQVSWLEVKPQMAVQYYRLLSPLPEGASRQMNIYDVQVKGHILEMSLEDYMRSIR